MKNNFVWCDLSTFDVDRAKKFYTKIFDWQYTPTSDRSMSNTYHIAYQDQHAMAALYVMPDFFQKIKMPSFWMSYIQVDDIEEIVAKAKQHEGVIIEIEPTQFDEKSRIALIRDPSGAGFTIYEGPNLNGRHNSGHGCMVWNVHHVKSVKKIQAFYEDVFDWTIKKQRTNNHTYDVTIGEGIPVATIEEMDESVTGAFQYWMPIFEVQSQKEIKQTVKKLGGEVLVELDDGRVIYTDEQGGSFMCREQPYLEKKRVKNTKMTGWKTLVALIIIWASILLELQWLWGVFFLWMLIPDLKRGSTYFVEFITKKSNPLVYWLTMGSWLIMAIYLLTSF